MSDYYNYYPRVKCDDIDYRGVVAENWTVGKYGFVDTMYLIDSQVSYGYTTVYQVLQRKRPTCVVCKYPDDITLDKYDETE